MNSQYPTKYQMSILDRVFAQKTLYDYEAQLLARKNKKPEILSTRDKQLVDEIQDFELSNPLREAYHFRYYNLKALNVRARVREGIVYYDYPDYISLNHKQYGFKYDYGVSIYGAIWNFEPIKYANR